MEKKELSNYKWNSPLYVPIVLGEKLMGVIIVLSLILIMYLVLIEYFILVPVIIAIIFILLVTRYVAPQLVLHEITKEGIETLGIFYKYKELEEFWFNNKKDFALLTITTKEKYPGKLLIVVYNDSMRIIYKLLSRKIKYRKMDNQNLINSLNYGDYIEENKIVPTK